MFARFSLSFCVLFKNRSLGAPICRASHPDARRTLGLDTAGREQRAIGRRKGSGAPIGVAAEFDPPDLLAAGAGGVPLLAPGRITEWLVKSLVGCLRG